MHADEDVEDRVWREFLEQTTAGYRTTYRLLVLWVMGSPVFLIIWPLGVGFYTQSSETLIGAYRTMMLYGWLIMLVYATVMFFGFWLILPPYYNWLRRRAEARRSALGAQ